MSAHGNYWRLPGGYDPVVQARFSPGGKIYHYISNAAIGDTIDTATNSPATVVGHGWGVGVTPYAIREAHNARRTTKNTVERTITMNTDYGTSSSVEHIEQQLKAAKKDAKKARKAERERKAAAAEKARLYSAGIDALERLSGLNGDTGLEAAKHLLAESRR